MEKNQFSEFTPQHDDFEHARQKGIFPWIFKHIFYRSNKYFIFLWLIFIIGSGFTFNYFNIVFGDAIDAFTTNNYAAVLRFTILILVVRISGPILDLVANLIRETLAQRLERDTRDELYLNLLGKSQSFHDSQRIGDIMARATNDVRQLNFLISPAMTLIFDAFFNIILPIAFILFYYPFQLIAAPAFFPVFFLITLKIYMDQLGPVTQQIQLEFGNMNAVLNESLAGIELIKGIAKEKQSRKQYRKVARRYMELGFRDGEIKARYLPILIVAITITFGLIHGVILSRSGQYAFGLGDIVAYIGLLRNLMFPTNISIWAFSIVKRAVAGSERLLDIMNSESEIGEKAQPVVQKMQGKIEFRHAWFKYPGTEKYILKDINLEVSPGETLAIVGTTGSGKTTLTKLISRLYNVSKGEILIDGVNIDQYALESLRTQISYIEQDLFLFSNSIFDNISFGRVSSRKEVEEAAKNAQAHEFIQNMPQGYDTSVGERGVQLSGGERQRIAIARAFISDPRILILDDSTSAIDSGTEDRIQHAISRILKDRTTLLITHRLSQIRWADKIIVLKRGEIIASGDHYELLKQSAEYRKIFISRFDKSLDELLTKEAVA
jgi:ATP-binding cassette, subfamily B, bacterial